MNTYIYIKLFSVCLCFLAAISAPPQYIYVCDVFIFRPPILYILPLFKEYIFRPPPPILCRIYIYKSDIIVSPQVAKG